MLSDREVLILGTVRANLIDRINYPAVEVVVESLK